MPVNKLTGNFLPAYFPATKFDAMSATYVIADVHLHLQTPQLISDFLQFLQTLTELKQQNAVDALYIAGDLFEVWLGDDDNEPVYQQVIQALRTATQQQLKITILQGNRDFLLGQRFAQLTGCSVLNADEIIIDIYGTPALLMHGDTLCTDDIKYQQFRQKVRTPLYQKSLLALPLWLRRWIAHYARRKSRHHAQQMTVEIMDVAPSTVLAYLEKYQIKHLIHGHTHRPFIHAIPFRGDIAHRYVVGMWEAQHAQILCCTAQQWQLIDAKQLKLKN